METFSILGAGWLGFTLAKSLKTNYNIKVSIRDLNKKNIMISEGLNPYFLDENNLNNFDALLSSDYIFINFPPSKFKDYLNFLKKLYSNKNLENAKKIFFISSTSIYPKEGGIYDENSKLYNPSSKIVFDAEKVVLEKSDVIFRCSGLMGYDRVAGRYFSGKILDSEDVKINYIHRDDVIEATKFAISNNISGIFNLCSKEHPTKKEIYMHNAKKYGFDKPIFENKKEYIHRIIDGSKIEDFGFRYKYPNPYEY
jgi:nucleoside-diphosphate-sugar epimerase